MCLQVTSIISKIALLPHPNLNEYLLNPSLPIRQDALSLFSVLHSVVDHLQVRVTGIRHLKAKLVSVREALLGQSVSPAAHSNFKNSVKQNGPISSSSDDHHSASEVTPEERKILESLIVIEEFGKELAAIAFVKNQHLI